MNEYTSRVEEALQGETDLEVLRDLISELHVALTAIERQDTALLDWMDEIAKQGHAPAIVHDDGGHFGFADGGMSPLPVKGGFKETVSITSFVELANWKPSSSPKTITRTRYEA